MSTYQYKATQFLPVSPEEAWHFFSSPQNLSLITPPQLNFIIRSGPDQKDIYSGMKIDYTVKPILGIPLRWKTQIENVEYLRSFKDTQLKGPYKKWEHTHIFEQAEGGIIVKDVVNYELPLGWIGKIAHLLFVKRKIDYIFNYRKNSLAELFIIYGKNSD